MITAFAEVIQHPKKMPQTGHLWVRCQKKSGCNGCAAKQSCGVGIVNSALPESSTEILIQSDQNLPFGTQVEIGIDEQFIVQSSALIYLLPLMFAIVGAIIGDGFLNVETLENAATSEVGVILFSLIFGGLGFIFARYFVRRLERKNAAMPKLLRVISYPVNPYVAPTLVNEDSD